MPLFIFLIFLFLFFYDSYLTRSPRIEPWSIQHNQAVASFPIPTISSSPKSSSPLPSSSLSFKLVVKDENENNVYSKISIYHYTDSNDKVHALFDNIPFSSGEYKVQIQYSLNNGNNWYEGKPDTINLELVNCKFCSSYDTLFLSDLKASNPSKSELSNYIITKSKCRSPPDDVLQNILESLSNPSNPSNISSEISEYIESWFKIQTSSNLKVNVALDILPIEGVSKGEYVYIDIYAFSKFPLTFYTIIFKFDTADMSFDSFLNTRTTLPYRFVSPKIASHYECPKAEIHISTAQKLSTSTYADVKGELYLGTVVLKIQQTSVQKPSINVFVHDLGSSTASFLPKTDLNQPRYNSEIEKNDFGKIFGYINVV